MPRLRDRRIGIVGGMGPAAGHYFAQRITELAPAKQDQDHPVIIHYSNPAIADRTAHLVYGGPDPTPEIVKTIKQLDLLGVDVICIPCNTAHAPQLYSEYQKSTDTPIVHMVEETVAHIACEYQGIQRIGVLGTDGTKFATTYDRAAQKYGLTVVYPKARLQRKLMELIYTIKRRGVDSGDDVASLVDVINQCKADVYVLACTELSLLNPYLAGNGIPVVDSLEILAKRALGIKDARQTKVIDNRRHKRTITAG